MNLLSSLLLGILQGLTEFLPLSSSGHLVLAQSIIADFKQPGVLFDVVLHLGTLLAILVFFKSRILKLTKKYILLLVAGTIPAVVIGFLFSDAIEVIFANAKIASFALLITGFVNILTDRLNPKSKGNTIQNSLIIGVAQALAIIPGISRSGSTIFAGTALGMNRKLAAEFSFLLSIPAVFGANVLQIVKHGANFADSYVSYAVGFAAASIFGYLAIRLVYKFLLSKNFKIFGLYCLLVGLLTLIIL